MGWVVRSDQGLNPGPLGPEAAVNTATASHEGFSASDSIFYIDFCAPYKLNYSLIGVSLSCCCFMPYNLYTLLRCTYCMTCFLVDRCIPPPIVVNATISMDVDNRQLTVTCLEGHRFPNGKSIDSFTCSSDGSWIHISPCSRE